MKPAPVLTDLSALPEILTLKEIAGFYRISVGTIRRGLANGTFAPRPAYQHPYRWRRDDVVADVKGPRQNAAARPHGVAGPRPRRPKKAALDARGAATRTAS